MPDELSSVKRKEHNVQAQRDDKVKAIPSYSKVYNLGHRELTALFDNDVVVEEKLDGSQISFGVVEGKGLCMRSKNKEIILDAPDSLFRAAVDAIRPIADRLHTGWIYRGEYLSKPKHNTLNYDRIPDKTIMVFDIDTQVGGQYYLKPGDKQVECERVGLECVPFIQYWRAEMGMYTIEQLKMLLQRESVLGGTEIEGVVFKNYERYGGDGKVLMGKFVSEKFKEVHDKNWKLRSPGGQAFVEAIAQDLRTEARWQKAVQHLAEKGEITNTPADIGKLFKEVHRDVYDECAEEIKDKLFKWAWKQIGRRITAGLPEWYKEKLAEEQFDVGQKGKD